MQRAGLDRLAERLARSEQMFLPDEFLEPPRPQPIRQRLPSGRLQFLEAALHLPASDRLVPVKLRGLQRQPLALPNHVHAGRRGKCEARRAYRLVFPFSAQREARHLPQSVDQFESTQTPLLEPEANFLETAVFVLRNQLNPSDIVRHASVADLKLLFQTALTGEQHCRRIEQTALECAY